MLFLSLEELSIKTFFVVLFNPNKIGCIQNLPNSNIEGVTSNETCDESVRCFQGIVVLLFSGV